jgi:MFS family permease
MTWIFDGYEVSMLSLTSLELMQYFNVEESSIGFLSSIYLMGCCCGAVIFGVLSNFFGRKKLFSITLLIYLTSVITISCMVDYWGFLVCRFFTGFSNNVKTTRAA